MKAVEASLSGHPHQSVRCVVLLLRADSVQLYFISPWAQRRTKLGRHRERREPCAGLSRKQARTLVSTGVGGHIQCRQAENAGARLLFTARLLTTYLLTYSPRSRAVRASLLRAQGSGATGSAGPVQGEARACEYHSRRDRKSVV